MGGLRTAEARLLVSIHDYLAAEAIQGMVVHEPRCLHVCIANRRSDELEAALPKVFAHRFGLRAGGRIVLEFSEAVNLRSAIHELPEVFGEGPELLLDLEEATGVLNRCFDFEPVSNNAGVLEQALHVS